MHDLLTDLRDHLALKPHERLPHAGTALLERCAEHLGAADAALEEMQRERDEAEAWLADTQQRLDEATDAANKLVPNGQSRS